MDEYTRNSVTLLDDDGTEHKFEILDVINNKEGKFYALLTKNDLKTITKEYVTIREDMTVVWNEDKKDYEKSSIYIDKYGQELYDKYIKDENEGARIKVYQIDCAASYIKFLSIASILLALLF